MAGNCMKRSWTVHHLTNHLTTRWFHMWNVSVVRGRGLEWHHTAGIGDQMKSEMSCFQARWQSSNQKRRAAWGGACSAPKSISSRTPCWGAWMPAEQTGRRHPQVIKSPSHLTFKVQVTVPGNSHRTPMFTLLLPLRLMENYSSLQKLMENPRCHSHPFRCSDLPALFLPIGAELAPVPHHQNLAPAMLYLSLRLWANQTPRRSHHSTITNPPRGTDSLVSNAAEKEVPDRKPWWPHPFCRKVLFNILSSVLFSQSATVKKFSLNFRLLLLHPSPGVLKSQFFLVICSTCSQIVPWWFKS